MFLFMEKKKYRFYYAQINIGHPPRPYFVDPDTGSDLTWLQCDAPCVHCTQVIIRVGVIDFHDM